MIKLIETYSYITFSKTHYSKKDALTRVKIEIYNISFVFYHFPALGFLGLSIAVLRVRAFSELCYTMII